MQAQKEEDNLYLVAESSILYVKCPKIPPKTNILYAMFTKVAGYKINGPGHLYFCKPTLKVLTEKPGKTTLGSIKR